MSKVLITGATGNIGFEVIRQISKMESNRQIIAGVRDIKKAKTTLKDYSKISFTHFDFEDSKSFDTALKDIDCIFLLRPPHISNIDKCFRPLFSAIKANNIKNVVFLSVQGAEKSKVIPHNKIERMIKEQGLNYIFIRPSYFMQNLTTTLHKDIKLSRKIVLPAANAKFNWVDVVNVGEVAAILLGNFGKYRNRVFEITGLENENFHTVSHLISQAVNDTIRFYNVNPFKFYSIKKREGMKEGMIFVMILLHFLPRFQKEPCLSDDYELLTGHQPIDLKTFIAREINSFK